MFVELGYWDYFILFLFLIVTFIVALVFSRKNTSLHSYFQAGGSLPWFVAGTAMVATTFAADTPLAITEIIYQKGISGNWAWWYMSLGAVVTVFIFAPLWKRSGVLTDLEFISLRYTGVASSWLRGGKAVYLGGFMNILILAWVNLAMLKILESIFSPTVAAWLLVGLFGFALIYTGLMGLSGISYVDVFQFFFAMGGCILLAIASVNLPEVGGLKGITEKFSPERLDFFPAREEWGSFMILITVLWWTSWYPGSEPGGGGYIAQRILASKDENEATKASLWFLFSHYFLRPWPWILVALSAFIVFPHLTGKDQGKGFVFMIEKSLGEPGKGFLIATFLAAYLSTIATHLNWGASYLVNDLTKPFLWKDKSEKTYIRFSYLVQFISGLISLWICFFVMDRISSAWFFLIEASSGVGFALVFRWFWWRITAWSELTGFIFSPIAFLLIKFFTDLAFPFSALANAILTIVVVILVTYLFPEKNTSYLITFYERVRPNGIGWDHWLKSVYDISSKDGVYIHKDQTSWRYILLLSLLSLVSVFSGLGGLGKIFFGSGLEILIYGVVFAISSGFLVRNVTKIFR